MFQNGWNTYKKNTRRNMNMKIVIASDFSGYQLKQAVKTHLVAMGFVIEDVGQQDEKDMTMYYAAAANLAKAIQSGNYEKGIAICGTGAGVSMIANKFTGIYCVPCESVYTAEKISLINNANVLAMGQKVVSFDMACEMAEKFLENKWCEGFAEDRRRNNENGFAILQKIEKDNGKLYD